MSCWPPLIPRCTVIRAAKVHCRSGGQLGRDARAVGGVGGRLKVLGSVLDLGRFRWRDGSGGGQHRRLRYLEAVSCHPAPAGEPAVVGDPHLGLRPVDRRGRQEGTAAAGGYDKDA
jgi:hypothetical protein